LAVNEMLDLILVRELKRRTGAARPITKGSDAISTATPGLRSSLSPDPETAMRVTTYIRKPKMAMKMVRRNLDARNFDR
jgi:hypothetical protein